MSVTVKDEGSNVLRDDLPRLSLKFDKFLQIGQSHVPFVWELLLGRLSESICVNDILEEVGQQHDVVLVVVRVELLENGE